MRPGSAGAAPLGTSRARQARARILELARHSQADQAFLEELSTELRKVVHFDGAFWSAADPHTSLATAPARVENLATEQACQAYWDTEFLVHDFIHFRDLARAERPAATLYAATDGHLARSTRYRLVNRELGFGDELRGVFRSEHSVWGLVSLYRQEDMPAFTIAEEKVLGDLSAPLAQTFRRSALIRRGLCPDVPDAPGMVTFNAHGVLESLNAQAEAWLEELQPPKVLGPEMEYVVPTVLLTVSARARAIAAGLDEGVAQARIQSRSGRWLIVHGFSLRGVDGDRHRTALVIEPARTSQIAPIIVEAYELTPREQEITRCISYGLSTNEMAARLHLSVHTVRDYVKQVFEKVGVSSRGELVAKIFAEHYASPLFADAVHVSAQDAYEAV